MSTKSDSFFQKVENGHSVHWIQKPRILFFNTKLCMANQSVNNSIINQLDKESPNPAT